MAFRAVYFLFILTLFFPAGCKEKEVRKYTISFSQCTGGDAWRRDMLRGMQRELAFHPYVHFTYHDAQGSSRKQVAQIRQIIREHPDLLIVSPNEAEPITPVVEEAYQKGIPVVVVDRKTASSFYTAYVGGNNYEVGKTAGAYIGELLKGKGKVIQITGLPTSSPAVDRQQGFRQALENFPGIELVHTLAGDWEKQVAKRRLENVLDRQPAVDLIFAHNDVMALGAYEVWQKKGGGRKVKIVGIDGLAGPMGGIQLVNDGVLDATLLYPTGGEEAIRTAMQILEKKPYQKENILNTAVIDASNARMIKLQTDKILEQQQDIERQKKQNQQQIKIYKSQQVVLYVMAGLLVLAIVTGSLALYWLKEKKDINKKLKAKNKEILRQRNQIQELAEQAQAATESKFSFFTNISHEFRTPLTLILGPIDSLLQGKADHLEIKQNLKLMQKNARRLLWLVNQLMDFRKLESGKMPVKATENDLIAFIRDIMLPFEQLAKKRNIRFSLHTSLPALPVWFDVNMMDKVFFNLLSNAFKFTPDHGRIHLSVEKEDAGNQVLVKVSDTGTGMSAQEAARAFEVFFQGSNAAHKGTGLGLPLSREFVALHHGHIQVSSQPNKGTTFELRLLLGHDHFKEEEKFGRQLSADKDLHQNIVEDTSPVWEAQTHTEKKSQRVLVIEDHAELRNFLQFTLQAHYQVLAAGNGAQGLEQAQDNLPDLIICDLTLPDTDGLQLLSTLKADLRTSHIPVIILTARSGLEHQLAGMQAGAELYLTKPFSPQILKESVRSLLANRQLAKEYFTSGGSWPLLPAGAGEISKIDKKFLDDFKKIIDAKLADSDLSVDYLSREIGLSRVQLYRKIKALLGCNVNDYIQTARLNKSCLLLQDPQASIADVAYQVGFSSATYFSTAFKAKYHISPTDYKSQKAYLKQA